MNIYYFHGLDSSLNDEKRKILQQFGNVNASVYNYRGPGVLEGIAEWFDGVVKGNSVIIGSSFGGYVAQMLAEAYNLPCLLFNPALFYRSIDASLKMELNTHSNSLSYIVLGKKDDVVTFSDNFQFVSAHIKEPKKVMVEEDMAHQVPAQIFEKHVTQFFKEVKMSNFNAPPG